MTSDVEPVGIEGLVLDAELVDEHQAHAELDVVGPSTAAAELVAEWLARPGKSANTRAAYARDIAPWLEFLDEQGVDVLDARGWHVEEYQRRITSTPLPRTGELPATSTVRRRLESVSSLYEYGVKREVLMRNPVNYIERPHVDPDHSDTRALTEDEARRFLRAAFDMVGEASGQDVKRVADRDSVMVATVITTGLRASEIRNVNVTDLGYDRGHRVLRVTRKGGKKGVVVLGPAAELIDRRIALSGQTAGPLFTTRSGKRVGREWLFRVVRRIAVAAAIPDPKTVTVHALRHTFATLALDEGATLHDLQAALGHADPRTTQRYDHLRGRVDRSPVLTVGPTLLKGNNDKTSRLF